jgi:transcription factor 1
MAPLLEKYKGCDVLDLNPGVGLWSSKLHDFLQPRNHVLLESSFHLYSPYLQPLLDKPGSTYKLIEGDIGNFSTFDKLVEEGVFPHQKPVAAGDPQSQELNKSLLVTGTLMWDPPVRGFGFDSLAGQILAYMAKSHWANEGIAEFGPVASLFWAKEADVKYMLPKGMHSFIKSSFLVPRTTDIAEVVTSDHASRLKKQRVTDSSGSRLKSRAVWRQTRYEIQSLVQALKRGKENGFELPKHRRENIHDFADDIANMTNGTGIISFADFQNYLKKQESLGKSTEGVINSQVYEQMMREKSPEEFKKTIAQYRATAKKLEKNRVQIDGIVDLGEAIYHLECEILAMEDGPDKDAKLTKLHEMERDFEKRAAKVNSNIRTSVYTELDDRIALNSPVPRLAWDQRPFEPLIRRPGEVWPESDVGLYYLTPRPRPADLSLEDWEYEQDFIHVLFQTKVSSLPDVLDSIQHGGSAILDEIPILRDPKKGGRLNLKQLRARMLTLEMVDALNKAYREWPFRNPEIDRPNYFRFKYRGQNSKFV